MRLTNTSCMVTGGASGLGRAIARRLAAEAGLVAVADLDGDRAAVVAAEIRDRGGKAIPVELDVSEEGAVTAAVQHVVATFG